MWQRALASTIPLLMTASAALAAGPPEPEDYRAVVTACLDTLIAHGSDTYGPEKTPVLVSILDAQSLTCPENPELLDEPWRVIRNHRRNPAGADLASDMATLTAMNRLGGKYAAFAKTYAVYYMNHMVSEKTGLVCWGWHEYYDVFQDKCHFDQHELHAGVDPMDWDLLWDADPAATRREIENIWRWHVIDKETGEINRHGDGKRGCDFSMSAGAFIEAFAFLYSKTSEDVWLKRARLLADYYWNRRNPETSLTPERPNAGTERFDGGHFVTSITGPHCLALLNAYDRCADAALKDHATAYLAAYAQHGYHASANRYWGSLLLDATPNDAAPVADGYAKYEPRGYLELWEPYVLGYQYPIYTGQAYLHAYEATQDSAMLVNARRIAGWVLSERPAGADIHPNRWYAEYAKTHASQGTYAGKYGRAITLLLGLHQATNEARYLQGAREYADSAIAKLRVDNGLIKGHPAKP